MGVTFIYEKLFEKCKIKKLLLHFFNFRKNKRDKKKEKKMHVWKVEFN